MCKEICDRTPKETQSQSDCSQKTLKREETLCTEQKGDFTKKETQSYLQQQKASMETRNRLRLDGKNLANMSRGMEQQMCVLWEGREIDTRSFCAVVASAVSGYNSEKYGSCVLEMQLLKGQTASYGVDWGQASVCPNCGKAGFSRISPSICWMNPPYGPRMKQWIKKAWNESGLGSVVVMLLPARTNSGYWHDYCFKGEVRFIRGYPKFGNAEQGLKAPLAVVIFRPR
jgi:hypothetical protein